MWKEKRQHLEVESMFWVATPPLLTVLRQLPRYLGTYLVHQLQARALTLKLEGSRGAPPRSQPHCTVGGVRRRRLMNSGTS